MELRVKRDNIFFQCNKYYYVSSIFFTVKHDFMKNDQNHYLISPHNIWVDHIIFSWIYFFPAVMTLFHLFPDSRHQVKWSLSGTQGISAVLREWILRLLAVILGKISLSSCDNRDFIFILLGYRVSKAWATK